MDSVVTLVAFLMINRPRFIEADNSRCGWISFKKLLGLWLVTLSATLHSSFLFLGAFAAIAPGWWHHLSLLNEISLRFE